jgi:hypothetical protein
MAAKHSSKPKLVAVTPDREHPLSSARRKIVKHATWQLESVLDGITNIARKSVDPDAQGQLLALAMRAEDLNGATMSAVGDDGDDVSDLVATLNTAELDTLATEIAHG